MSEDDKKASLSEEQLESLLASAFREEMIPTSLEEVRRAEAEAGEVKVGEIPAFPEERHRAKARTTSQAEIHSPGEENLRSLADARRQRQGSKPAWLQWGVAASLGAAAAALVMTVWAPQAPTPPIRAGGGELPLPPEPREAEAIVDVSAPCEECCAGVSCTSKPLECASGRSCVSCEPSPEDRFRLRLGDLSWHEQLLGSSDVGAYVCVQVGRSDEECIGKAQEGQSVQTWSKTQGTYSATQLLNGVRLRLRRGKDDALLAEWTRKVSLTPDTRCRGLAVQFTEAKGSPVARLSAFVDDAQFIEVARAASSRELLRLREKFKDPGSLGQIFETSAEGSEHFAFSFGPLSGAQLERVRWLLLDAGQEVQVTTGQDYQGAPR